MTIIGWCNDCVQVLFFFQKYLVWLGYQARTPSWLDNQKLVSHPEVARPKVLASLALIVAVILLEPDYWSRRVELLPCWPTGAQLVWLDR